MPIYEYECGKCRSRFEMRQRFDEDPMAVCPECSGTARRIFQPAPIIFKGSGFYITDHRKNNPHGLTEGKTETPQTQQAKGK